MLDNFLIRFLIKRPILSVLLGIILVYLPIPLLIRPAIWGWLNFTGTGQIGDTIGGITAPIIGLIGAVLIFISFLAQIEANKIQNQAIQNEILRNRDEKNMDLVLTLYREWRDDFENLSYNNQRGTIALINAPNNIQNWKNSIIEVPYMQSFLHVWREMELLLNRAEAMSDENGERTMMSDER